MSDNYVMVWEAPVIEKPEFRLYYDEDGYVMFYTCEKPEGNYLVVDVLTYAEGRPDVRVLDGRLIKSNSSAVISRLYPDTEGTLTEKEDLSIITDSDGQYWKLKTYEL